MAQFRQLSAQHKQLVTALQRANQLLATKQLDQASKEYIAGLQAQAQVAIAAAKFDSAHGIEQLRNEYARIEQLLNLNHDRLMAEAQNAHEVRLQDMQNEAQPVAAQAQ
jgi:hypothetical protein